MALQGARGLKSTNYFDAFITVAADCPARTGVRPPKPDTIAGLQYALLADQPYRMTSDDLLFEVHRRRTGAPAEDREAFFAKPQACLRASPLVKQFGWGVHHDAQGRIAIYGVETPEYRRLSSDPAVKIAPGMRNRRA